MRHGAFDVRGERIINDVAPIRVKPNSTYTYEAGTRWSYLVERGFHRTGACAVLYDPQGVVVAQHRVFFARFGDLDLDPNPEIRLTQGDGLLTLESPIFVWGVCLDTDGESPVPDNCFDLLPNVPYRLPWDTTTLGEPRIVRTGNRDALK